MRYIGFVYLGAFLLCIILANAAISHFGIIPVGFGLMAPAGVLFVGLTFTFRDLAQDYLNRWWIPLVIIIGALLSYFINPVFALASGATFLFSEIADFLVYTPLRKKNWIGAIVASNTVGVIIDSVFFLWIAFGSLDFLAGQVVAKLYMTVLAVLFLFWFRKK